VPACVLLPPPSPLAISEEVSGPHDIAHALYLVQTLLTRVDFGSEEGGALRLEVVVTDVRVDWLSRLSILG
jgi:hypothetical protein